MGQLPAPCSRTISDRPLIQPTEAKPQPNTQIIGPKRGEEKFRKWENGLREVGKGLGQNILSLWRGNKKDVKIQCGSFNERLKERARGDEEIVLHLIVRGEQNNRNT